MTWAVYVIIVNEAEKFYVGRTKNVDRRIRQHFSQLKDGKHCNVNLQKIWDNFGQEKFEFEIIANNLTERDSIDIEENFIKDKDLSEFRTNILISGTFGGDAITFNPNKKEILEKISIATAKNVAKMSLEDRKNRYSKPGSKNGMFGKTHSDEARRKMSEANVGNQHAKGAIRSKEFRENMREIAKSRVGEKNHFFGKKHTIEAREKMRIAGIGRKPINRKPVVVDGVLFDSVSDAAKSLNVSAGTIIFRIKSKYWDYQYENC